MDYPLIDFQRGRKPVADLFHHQIAGLLQRARDELQAVVIALVIFIASLTGILLVIFADFLVDDLFIHHHIILVDRHAAQIALKYAGVGGVIAQSFARIFFRNCINVGFPVVTLADTSGLNQGDEIVVDLLNGTIEDITTGKTYQGSKLPEHVLSIVEDGGLKNHLKKTLKKA